MKALGSSKIKRLVAEIDVLRNQMEEEFYRKGQITKEILDISQNLDQKIVELLELREAEEKNSFN